MSEADSLYAIVGKATRRVKIGRAIRPTVRLQQLQFSSPDDLAILAMAPGYGCHELALHGYFACLRLYGEWFDTRLTLAIEAALVRGTFESWVDEHIAARRRGEAMRLAPNPADAIARVRARTVPFRWRGKLRTTAPGGKEKR